MLLPLSRFSRSFLRCDFDSIRRRTHPAALFAATFALCGATFLAPTTARAQQKQTGQPSRGLNFSGMVTPTTGPYAGQQFYTGSHALIVGIDRYEYLPKDTYLQFAEKDARDLRDLLVRSYGFPADSITLLLGEQATKANIEATLDSFADSAVGENDRVLIYFSGHGQTVPTSAGGQMGFLIPCDAKVDLAKPQNKGGYLATCIAMDSLWSRLGLSAARHAFVIADACYGGLLVRSKGLGGERPNAPVIASLLARPARQVLTAGGAGETALEDVRLGHGAFTYKLLEELRAQAARPDTIVTATELASSLRNSVSNLTSAHQTPRFDNYGGTEGDFLFITTPPHAVPPLATAAVQSAASTHLAATSAPVKPADTLASRNAKHRPVPSPPVRLATLTGHSDIVTAVSFSPNGRYIVTGSYDGTAKVWNAATGKEIRTLEGHGGAVTAAGFSADSFLIVTGSADKTARVWDTAGRTIQTFTGHTAGVTSASFSPDGRYVVTGSLDHTAKVWDMDTSQPVYTLAGHTDVVTAASFSPDGRYIVTGSDDNTAKVWDAASGHEMRTLSGHGDHVYSASFSPDSRYIVTASDDMTAKLWEVATWQDVQTFRGHAKQLHAASFSPDGRYIVTGSLDDTAKVWDVATGKEIRTLAGHTNTVYAAAFSPDGRYIVTGSQDDTAKVWEAATGRTK